MSDYGDSEAAPMPLNFLAMSKAWNNSELLRAETEKYNDQLRAAGFEPVPL